MKKTYSLIAATSLAIAGFASSLHAQIITRNINVVGAADNTPGGFHPSTWVTVSADITLNTFTVSFANTTTGSGNFVGTITSFGFNTPFTNAALGANGANVGFTSTKSGWGIFEPYNLSQGSGVFIQDLGAGVGNGPEGGNPGNGVHYGESATFVFTLPDFTSADGFFDSAIDFTVRWQQVGALNGDRSGSDFGGGDGPSDGDIPTGAVPEPSTYALFGALALAGLASKRRFQKSRA